MTIVEPRRAAILLTALGMVVSCAKDDPPKVDLAAKAATDSAALELSPAAARALDSANVLFRAKAYDAALAQYREAATASPRQTTPLFGIYMVAKTTRNARLADSAMAEIRLRDAGAAR
jgi:hypothetical protein